MEKVEVLEGVEGSNDLEGRVQGGQWSQCGGRKGSMGSMGSML